LSSQISDGAAALLIASDDAVRRHGLRPRARIIHLSARGDDPVLMLTAPIAATARALKTAGLTLDDIDLVEINEAFASVVLAWQRETGADLPRVNVSGGALALGHPLRATATRAGPPPSPPRRISRPCRSISRHPIPDTPRNAAAFRADRTSTPARRGPLNHLAPPPPCPPCPPRSSWSTIVVRSTRCGTPSTRAVTTVPSRPAAR